MSELEYLQQYARENGEKSALENAADTIEKLRGRLLPQIRRMAEGMQFKIDKNMHKPGWLTYNDKGERIWNSDMISFLEGKLGEESYELVNSIRDLHNTCWQVDMSARKKDVFYEACDVANIAMMLADACGAILDKPTLDSD